MKRNGKTDREQWRDEFERTGQNPVAWQAIGRAHLAAANVLLQPLHLSKGGKVQPARVVVSTPTRRHKARQFLDYSPHRSTQRNLVLAVGRIGKR